MHVDTTVSQVRARAGVAAMLATPALAMGTKHWLPERPSEPMANAERAAGGTAQHGVACELSIGTQLPGSRLRILDRISDGGCGVVYRGEHVDLQRQVAIKVLRVEALTAGARELFLDEARTTTRIESPYVVQVVDFGELPDGRVWYAMEHLGGHSLDQMIAGGRIEAARAIALLRMACKGLGASHAAGVVHRDVKPQNLVVIERNGRDHLVLVDFGIALPCGTKPAVVSGTPEYMSREQILRDVLDARTDVYGLGCCAYEMLTGLPLVSRDATVQHALMLHSEGIDPSFPPELAVPIALQDIVRRCLAVDPSERFADMHELEAALCEAQITARLPPVRDDLELPDVEPVRRLRIAEGFAALVRPRQPGGARAALLSSMVIAAALTLVAFWPGKPAAADPAEARVAASSAPVDASVVPAAAMLAGVVAAEPSSRATAPSAEISTTSAAPISAMAATASVSRSAAAASVEQAVATPIAPRVAASERPRADGNEPAHDATRDGRRALRRGDRGAAEAAFRRALHLDPRSSGALAGLADVYFERGEHDRAMQFAKLAVVRSPRSAAHRIRLGDAYYRLARYVDARAEYNTAKQLGSPTARRRLAALQRAGS